MLKNLYGKRRSLLKNLKNNSIELVLDVFFVAETIIEYYTNKDDDDKFELNSYKQFLLEKYSFKEGVFIKTLEPIFFLEKGSKDHKKKLINHNTILFFLGYTIVYEEIRMEFFYQNKIYHVSPQKINFNFGRVFTVI